MEGHCGRDAERFMTPEAHLEILVVADGRIRTVPIAPVPIGTSARSVCWGALLSARRAAIEAAQIVDQAGQRLDQYTVYDCAMEFFGVKVLTLGQMPAFRIALALGLVARPPVA